MRKGRQKSRCRITNECLRSDVRVATTTTTTTTTTATTTTTTTTTTIISINTTITIINFVIILASWQSSAHFEVILEWLSML